MKIALDMAGFEGIPADSEIFVAGRDIRKVLFGIDIGAAELMMAKDEAFDAVIAHHPSGGRTRLNAWKVFERHVFQMTEMGVPGDVARETVRKKAAALEIEAHSTNYDHLPSIARHLKMPFMNIHNPLDELGRKIVTERIRKLTSTGRSATVADVISSIRTIREFQQALTEVKLRHGALSNKAGRIVFSHAAYTNGGYDVAKTYYKYGVDTVVYIHISEPDLAKLRADGVGNLIVTGHIASDSVGINPFTAELRKRGVEVEAIGGVIGT
jgi:putative NIF3 family GTP cyclohydrolase 1 type 2